MAGDTRSSCDRVYTLKFVLAGSRGVGKTQLASLFHKKHGGYPSVGMQFATRTLRYGEHSCLRAQVSLPQKAAACRPVISCPRFTLRSWFAFLRLCRDGGRKACAKAGNWCRSPACALPPEGIFGHAALPLLSATEFFFFERRTRGVSLRWTLM